MVKETFKYVCDVLRSTLKPKPNPLTKRPSISVEEQVAIGIYYLFKHNHIVQGDFAINYKFKFFAEIQNKKLTIVRTILKLKMLIHEIKYCFENIYIVFVNFNFKKKLFGL